MISSSTPAIEGRAPSSQPQPDSGPRNSNSLDISNSDTSRPNSIGDRSTKHPRTETHHQVEDVDLHRDDLSDSQLAGFSEAQERHIRRKVDFRLCTIAGILCSLNLLDSGVLSSAAVTSMPSDLGLDHGNRFSVSIFIFTVASIIFQLPSTIAVRTFGPRVWFSFITFSFGIITLSTGFVKDWKQMIALRVLLGATSSGIYPGLSYLISCWYPRREQQVRFAFMQSGEVIILATGSLVNYGLQQRNGGAGLEGWRWMFIVQGLCTCVLGIATYWWIVDFPENSHKSFWFLTEEEADIASRRIEKDRGDLIAQKFSIMAVLIHAKDFKIWVFACLFFMQNVVSTALAYFVPIILENGLGYSPNQAIILSAPPYYYAVVPVILSSVVADRFRIRGPIITFNALCMITGFAVLGFADNSGARYFGVFLSTGAYVANWAALTAYQANNVVGQWKRVFTAAACTMFNGAGGIAGSYIVRNVEAPRYTTAVWVSIGSHILMISLVGVLTIYFYFRNNRAARTNGAVERTTGFRYTY